MSQQSPSPRTEVRRKPQRAHHDPATIRAIIDQALVCQIAFNQVSVQPSHLLSRS